MNAAASSRPYESAVRAEQARRTRRQIVEAALALFADRGFGSTTISAIAEAAGVSRKTIFDSVGGKVQLVRLGYDFAITGDDEAIPLAEREVISQLMAEPDPHRKMAGFAELVTTINGRIVTVYRVLQGAAEYDPEARELLETLQDQRRSSMEYPMLQLSGTDSLRPGLSAVRAADLLWLYTDPTLYEQLVHRCGWSVDEFRDWLAATFQEQLLRPS